MSKEIRVKNQLSDDEPENEDDNMEEQKSNDDSKDS